ncbi:MAG TPA: multicopper oxidase domain-containing protein, partial [Syntrophales bacterium]|nr:multicopper oxidase domain-containing protein [Syntrophales bacterium]
GHRLLDQVDVGSAGAQGVTPQTLLPGALIPKFVDPLPVAVTGVSVVDATGGGGTGPVTYNITMSEFRAQILPSTGVPANPKAKFLGLPAGTSSPVWGYLIDSDIPAPPTPIPVRNSYLGPVVVAKKGVETQPVYINALPYGTASLVQPLLPTDQTLDWANPLGTTGCVGTACGIYLGPQPAVPHIHGGEVEPAYDGGPDAWWTPTGIVGSGSPAVSGSDRATFIYPTQQQAGTIWFHDHALGVTRLNVFAGMAGLYIITDPGVEPAGMPAFPQYDIPLIIQDRSFDTLGRIFYNLASNPQPNPLVHPFWIPEFIGDAILVNGKTWPYLAVEPRQYRFRLVNGSNARFYDLTLSNAAPFLVIATDDGYLNNPVSTPNLIIAPGERYEVIVDFTGLVPNAVTPPTIIMKNSARTPFPGGGKVVTGTTDTVMQFRVSLPLNPTVPNTTVTAATNLRPLNPIENIKTGAVATRPVPVAGVCPPVSAGQTIVRQLTLNEVIGPGGPLELVLNNTKYNGVVAGITGRNSEQPAVGDTEIWEIINITADAHPIHTHLASFQLLNRQAFQATKWTNVYAGQLAVTFGAVPDGKGPPNQYLLRNADCAIGGNPPIGPYLQKGVRLPLPYENGWKDTVIAYPGEVTRIVVRWAPTEAPASGTLCDATTPVPPCVPTAGVNLYPFNPTQLIGGVGYVWHCHIVDHEDNEMMRPYIVGAQRQLIQ